MENFSTSVEGRWKLSSLSRAPKVTPNQPLEWTCHQQISDPPPQASCLPLRGSVREMGAQADEAHGGILSV
jgi:hypothetical protein